LETPVSQKCNGRLLGQHVVPSVFWDKSVQTYQQTQENHSVFRLLVIGPIWQHSCISLFLCFTSLNPFFVIGFLCYLVHAKYIYRGLLLLLVLTSVPLYMAFSPCSFCTYIWPSVWVLCFTSCCCILSPFLHVPYSFHVIVWSLFLCMVCGHRLHIYRSVPVRLHWGSPSRKLNVV
jgi:hypothetical protein